MVDKQCPSCTFCLSMGGFQDGMSSVSVQYCCRKEAQIVIGGPNRKTEKFPTMCVDMREAGGLCGPEGALFVQYVEVPALVVPARTPTTSRTQQKDGMRPRPTPFGPRARQKHVTQRPAPYKAKAP